MHLSFGPQSGATIADSNLSDRAADRDKYLRSLFSDNVFVFERDGRRVAVIAEVQSERPNGDCSLSWPAYVANARRRHRCDTLLMVFAITKNAALGSAKPIRMGHPGWDLVPLISGIGRTPGTPPTGGQFAAELVLLRIITGELTLDTHEARMFALSAVRSAPPERRERYTRYLKALAPQSVQKPLEALMRMELKDAFIDGWIDQGLNQGRLEASRRMMLQLLDKRFSMPEDIRKQVEECTDIAMIDAWFDRAITSTSLEEVFAELRVRVFACAVQTVASVPNCAELLDNVHCQDRRALASAKISVCMAAVSRRYFQADPDDRGPQLSRDGVRGHRLAAAP